MFFYYALVYISWISRVSIENSRYSYHAKIHKVEDIDYLNLQIDK